MNRRLLRFARNDSLLLFKVRNVVEKNRRAGRILLRPLGFGRTRRAKLERLSTIALAKAGGRARAQISRWEI